MNLLPNEILWSDGDLFRVKWIQNGEGEGQYGQKYQPPFLDRWLFKLDRDEYRREQAVLQIDCSSLLIDEVTDSRRLHAWEWNKIIRERHGPKKAPVLMWSDRVDDETRGFSDYPKIELIADTPIVPEKLWILESLRVW